MITKHEYRKIKASINSDALNWLKNFYESSEDRFRYNISYAPGNIRRMGLDIKYAHNDITSMLSFGLVQLVGNETYVRTRKGQEFFEMGEK